MPFRQKLHLNHVVRYSELSGWPQQTSSLILLDFGLHNLWYSRVSLFRPLAISSSLRLHYLGRYQEQTKKLSDRERV